MLGAIVGGVASLAGIGTNIRAAREKRKIERENNALYNGIIEETKADKKENEKMYNRAMSENYLDTAEARSSLAQLRESNKKQLESATNNLIRNGATEESKIAVASGLNRNYADAASRMAGLATKYREDATDRYLQQKDKYNSILYNAWMNRANMNGNIGNSKANAAARYGNMAAGALKELVGTGIFN